MALFYLCLYKVNNIYVLCVCIIIIIIIIIIINNINNTVLCFGDFLAYIYISEVPDNQH
jgi:hypothetical protein